MSEVLQMGYWISEGYSVEGVVCQCPLVFLLDVVIHLSWYQGYHELLILQMRSSFRRGQIYFDLCLKSSQPLGIQTWTPLNLRGRLLRWCQYSSVCYGPLIREGRSFFPFGKQKVHSSPLPQDIHLYVYRPDIYYLLNFSIT